MRESILHANRLGIRIDSDLCEQNDVRVCFIDLFLEYGTLFRVRRRRELRRDRCRFLGATLGYIDASLQCPYVAVLQRSQFLMRFAARGTESRRLIRGDSNGHAETIDAVLDD
jgi:hypothetical protein